MKLTKTSPLFILVAVLVAAPLNAAPQGNLEKRVQRLEKLLESQGLVDLYLRLDNLQKEVQELRGTIEVQSNTLAGIKQRQRDLYLDIDRRLRQLESGATTPATTSQSGGSSVQPSVSATVTSASTTPVTPVTGTDKVAEETAYRAAFKLLKEGRYAPATSRFRDFIAKYPASGYADNAQYWLGEVSYVTRAFKQAIKEFDKVLQNYPDSTKHADALLKQGYCYYELQNYAKARASLNEVVGRFPSSTAARLAEKRRKRMKQEGH